MPIDLWRKWMARATVGILVVFSGACLLLWGTGQLAPPSTSAVFWSTAWSVVFMMVLVCALLIVASTGTEFLVWFSVGSLGAALGWVLGIYASPSSPEQASHFTELRTVVTGLGLGAVVTQLSALWQKLIEGNDPRIFQRRYAIPVLLFLGTGLISVAAQYNIRENAAGTVVVTLTDEAALERDASSHLPILNGPKELHFTAMVDHPGDSLVDSWYLDSNDEEVRRDIRDRKITIDPKEGNGTNSKDALVKNSLPEGPRGRKLKVVALSHWNHAWQGVYLLQLGTTPVQVASAKTATK